MGREATERFRRRGGIGWRASRDGPLGSSVPSQAVRTLVGMSRTPAITDQPQTLSKGSRGSHTVSTNGQGASPGPPATR
jgi:hypothetical protein